MFDLPLSPLMSWMLYCVIAIFCICIGWIFGFCLLSAGKRADENQESREQEIIDELDNKYKDKYKKN